MNREDLLRNLAALQEQIATDVDGYKYEERSERIAEIADEIHQNDLEITSLLEKLESNDNYIDQTPRLALDIEVGIAYDKMEDLKVDKEAVESKIESRKAVIDDYEALIASKKAIIKRLSDDNLDLEVAIRRAKVNKTDNEEITNAEFSVLMKQNQEQIDALKAEIKEAKNSVKVEESTIADLENEVVRLSNEVETAKVEFDKALKNRNQVINGKVDTIKKNADKRAVKALDAANIALENEQQLLAYDFGGKVNELITKFGNGEMSFDELKDELTNVKNNLPKDFLEDEEAKIDKLAENEIAQENIRLEIETLEARLSDDANYERNPEAVAKEKANLANIKKSHSKYKTLIAHTNKQNREIKASIKNKEDLISTNEEEINELNLNIQLNYERNREVANQLEAKRNELIAENNELERQIELDKEVLGANDAVLVDLNTKEARSKELITFFEEKAKENGIDSTKKRADEIKLTRARASLEALETYHRSVSYNVVAKINEIINANILDKDQELTETSEVVVNGASNDVSEEKETKNIVLPFPISDEVTITDELTEEKAVNKAADTDASEPIETKEEELTDEELALINDFNGDSKEETKEEKAATTVVPFVVPNVDDLTDEEKALFSDFNDNNYIPDDIGLGDGLHKVSNVSKEEDENLKEQANKKGFFAKAKKWVKDKLNYVIAYTALAVAGLAAIMSAKVNGPLPHAETVIESNIDNVDDNTLISSEENSDSKEVQEIESEINKVIEEENKEEKENKTQENSKEEVVINNNNNNNNNNTDSNTGNSNGAYVQEEVTYEHEEVAAPVDPSTIVDEHPDTNTAIPTPSEDEGEKVVVSGVTGDETVDENSWGEPVIEGSENENSGNTSAGETSGETSGDTTSSETKEDEDINWDDMYQIIEDEYTDSNGEAKDKGQNNQEEVKEETKEETKTEIKDQKPVNLTEEKVVLNKGETFVLNGASISNEGAKAYDTEKDIMLEDEVNSVQYVQNKEENFDILGEESIEVGVATRDHELSEEEVESIRNEQYGTTKEEMSEETRIWFENNPEMAEAFQAIMNAMQGSNQNTNEDSAKTFVR